MSGSLGLVVKGGDSCSKGCRFRIPAPYTGWTFFHIHFVAKIVMLFEKAKINEKEEGDGPLLK